MYPATRGKSRKYASYASYASKMARGKNCSRYEYRPIKHILGKTPWRRHYSQSADFSPRLRTFSESPRFTPSLAPSGNSAEISTTSRTVGRAEKQRRHRRRRKDAPQWQGQRTARRPVEESFLDVTVRGPVDKLHRPCSKWDCRNDRHDLGRLDSRQTLTRLNNPARHRARGDIAKSVRRCLICVLHGLLSTQGYLVRLGEPGRHRRNNVSSATSTNTARESGASDCTASVRSPNSRDGLSTGRLQQGP